MTANQSLVKLTVTPLDCARRKYLGVDRFRIRNGMAIEEHVVFDTAVLRSAG
jgi:hypothetical protein